MSATAPGGRSASFMTGACVSTGTATAALLTFLLRFLQAATDDDDAAAAEEVDEEEEDEEEEEEEEVVAADELVLLELMLNEDDFEVVDDEVVVGLTEVELEVGLVEVEVVVGLVEVEVLLSEDVSVLFEEIDVDEAAAEDDVIWAELVGREDDCEDDDRVVEEEENEEDIAELETEEDDCARAEDEDGGTEEDDDRAAELALDVAEVAAAKLELDKPEDEELELLLLLLLTTEELLLDEADITAADDAEIELDAELDDDRLIDRGSATCEEVGAAKMDVLNGLEDERVTDEVVEDGFTDVEVALLEVVLLLVFLLDEDEVEVGFCTIVSA